MRKSKTIRCFILAISGTALVLLLSSCTRRCHCIGRDGSHHYFTKEELDEMDMTCASMETTMAGLLYSICEYDRTDY